jgi:hypothetical protein
MHHTFMHVLHIISRNPILQNYIYINTVKPVLRGHLWDKEKVVF